jgi:hypothetical protein
MLMMDDARLLSRWCSTKGFAKLHLFLRFPNQHLGRSCAGNLKLKELPNYESLQDLWECSLTKIVNLHLGVGRVEIRICLPITLYIAIFTWYYQIQKEKHDSSWRVTREQCNCNFHINKSLAVAEPQFYCFPVFSGCGQQLLVHMSSWRGPHTFGESSSCWRHSYPSDLGQQL